MHWGNHLLKIEPSSKKQECTDKIRLLWAQPPIRPNNSDVNMRSAESVLKRLVITGSIALVSLALISILALRFAPLGANTRITLHMPSHWLSSRILAQAA